MKETEKLVNYFYENVKELDNLKIDEIKDIVSLCSIVIQEQKYAERLKQRAFIFMCRIIIQDKLSLSERWAIYWMLTYCCFISPVYDICREALCNTYESIYLDIGKLMPDVLLEEEKNDGNGPIVIVASQILSNKHAPTRRVLDYAYIIQNKFGIPVVIMNDAGTYSKEYEYLLFDNYYYYIEDYSDLKVISYQGEIFSFYQIGSKMINLNEIKKAVSYIKNLSPRLVLNVGHSSLVADLCRYFTKTASMPCSTSIPITMGEYLVLCRNINDDDEDNMERMQPYQKVVEAVFNYIMPDGSRLKQYGRKEFGIPDHAWLLVSSGHRMKKELDCDFMFMIDEILGDFSDFHFLIIGEVENPYNIVKNLKYKEKIHFAGGLEDGSQAIKLGDIYIQPTRKGGGRAAFEALYFSVPVITTKYGDAWNVCGEEFGVDSYADMKNRICEYYCDRKLYQNMQKLSKDKAAALEDMKGTFEKLFYNLGL